MPKYKMGAKKYKVVGRLSRTRRKARIIRGGVRTIFKDQNGKLFVKLARKVWKFPEEIEY